MPAAATAGPTSGGAQRANALSSPCAAEFTSASGSWAGTPRIEPSTAVSVAKAEIRSVNPLAAAMIRSAADRAAA